MSKFPSIDAAMKRLLKGDPEFAKRHPEIAKKVREREELDREADAYEKAWRERLASLKSS